MPAFPPGQNNPNAYNISGAPFGVGNGRTTPLSSAFDQWLRNPSPTTERLVDQVLTNAGRPAMFQSRGRVGGQIGGDYSALSSAFARAAYTMQQAAQSMGRRGPGQQYGGQANLDPFFTATASQLPMFGRISNMPSAPIMYRPEQIGKFIKDIRDASLSEDRTLKRILQLEERLQIIAPGAGRSAATIAAARSAGFANVIGGWGAPPAGGGGAPPAGGGGAYQPPPPRWGGFRPGSGDPLFPPPPPPPPSGGGAGGGFGSGAAFGRLGAIISGLRAVHGAAVGAPMIPASFAEQWFNPSRPLTDMVVQLSNLTRGAATRGGLGGSLQQDMLGMLVPEWGRAPPPGFQEFGVTPQMYLQSLGRVGGLRPGMANMGANAVMDMRRLRLAPGFSNMPEGTVESLAMMGSRLGMATNRDTGTFPRVFAGAMEEAFNRGLDQSEILRAIKGATETTAQQAAAAPDVAQITRMFQQMMQLNMPGARTGAMQREVIGGVNQFANQPFANAMSASLALGLTNSVDWSSQSQLQQFFGAEGLANLQKSPFGKTALSLMADKNQPTWLRAWTAARLSRMAPGSTLDKAMGQVSGIIPGGGPGSQMLQWMMTGAGMGGISPEAIAGFSVSRGLPVARGMTEPLPDTLPVQQFKAQVETSQIILKSMEDHFNTFGRSVDVFDKAVGGLVGMMQGYGRPAGTAGPGISGGGGGWRQWVPIPGFAPHPGAPDVGGGSLGGWFGSLLGGALGYLNPIGSAHAAPLGRGLGLVGAPSTADPRGMEPIIRAAAAKYGIDPNVAMAVARSEGLGTFAGDHGTSFGALQLHVGGGLGDAFRRETRLDPSNPKNEAATIDFALRHASKHGWGAFHGAARSGIGRMQGIGTGTQNAIVRAPGSGGFRKGVDDMMSLIGHGADPTVKEFIKRHGGNLDPSTAAWCAAFVNASLADEGIRGTGSNIASSFGRWGAAVSAGDVQKGDVILKMQRAGRFGATGGHVGRATGMVDPRTGRIQMISGNTHGGRVDTSWEDPGGLIIRRAGEAEGAGVSAGGGAAAGIDLHDAFRFLGRAAREVGEHLHELGHGARRANAGMAGKSGAQNPPTSPTSFQESAAFP